MEPEYSRDGSGFPLDRMPYVLEVAPYLATLLLATEVYSLGTDPDYAVANTFVRTGMFGGIIAFMSLTSKKARSRAKNIVTKMPYQIAEGVGYLTGGAMVYEAHRIANTENLENVVLELGALAGLNVVTGLLFRRARQKSGIEF